MLDEYGFEIFEENAFPIAYLLTFRTYGTWLHGDSRGAFQRHRTEPIPAIQIAPNIPLHQKMLETSGSEPVILSDRQRELVSDSIEEVCAFRGYDLRALDVRTNHAHVVVSKSVKPEKILNDLKAYATRKLRGEKAVASDQKVWSRHGSTRYLWKPKQVQSAIEYVLYGQGDLPFEPNKV